MPFFLERKHNDLYFKIKIVLKTQVSNEQKEFFPDEQTITLDDIPQFKVKSIYDQTLDAFKEISMSYVIRKGFKEKQHLTAVCIDGRTIPIRLLPPKALPLEYSAIFLFKSDLFTGKSDSARQRLVLPDDIPEAALFRSLRQEMSGILNEELPEIREKNNETKKRFEERYPHLTGLFDEDTVGIIDKDEAIEVAQSRFFKKQKEVLESDSLDDSTFEKSLEISSRTLAEYILYRDLIIKKLSQFKSEDREEDIHNLIVPRYKRFYKDELIEGIFNNNAWLLDDKFMSFRTILSEATMEKLVSEITLKEDSVEDQGRPDISMIFSADPYESEKVDVVVIEIKKRSSDDKETPYAATQLIKRADKLANYCHNIQRVWYFGIVEINDSLYQLLRNMRWTPLFSKGRVFYQEFSVTRADGTTVPTPVCLLSYDAIIKDAATRNHTFLEILKNDIKKANVKRRAHLQF